MPFDGKPSDYTKVAPPAPVFTRDNPPTRMSDAIVMAVADVEAQERAGVEYRFMNCAVCTAGAVMRRMGNRAPSQWDAFGPDWNRVLQALSDITLGEVGWAKREWPEGFSSETAEEAIKVAHPETRPKQWRRDMLALADRLRAEGS